MIWGRDPNERWGFYGGVGLRAGASIEAQTSIHHSQWKQIGYIDEHGVTEASHQPELKGGCRELVRNDPSFVGRVFLPLGVDLTLGGDDGFWSKLYFFTEIRPTAGVQKIPEIGGMKHAWSVELSHGIRYALR